MKIIELSIPQEEIELGPHAIIQRISESYPVHTHIGFYEIFLVVEGQAIHYINNSSQLISERSLVFVRPSDVHYYVALNRYDAQFIDVGFPQSELYSFEADSSVSIVSFEELSSTLPLCTGGCVLSADKDLKAGTGKP